MITDFDSYIGIIIFFCGLILVGITLILLSKRFLRQNRKKGINIDKLAEKDSKIAYIVWSVKFLNDQGKESYTRKLKNYYIPEIMQAYEQYQKVKSFHVKEMTAEAKKHYEKIVDLSYKVANVEVKKAAGEIVMDMDCNADVCENIYKKDGYSSMQEEFEKTIKIKIGEIRWNYFIL